MQVHSCVGKLSEDSELLFKSSMDSYMYTKLKTMGQEMPVVVSDLLLKGNEGAQVEILFTIQSHKVGGKRIPTLFIHHITKTSQMDSNVIEDLSGEVVTDPVFNLKKGTTKQFGSLVIKLSDESNDYMIRCHGTGAVARRIKATEVGARINVSGYLKKQGKRLAIYVTDFKED